MGVSITHFSAMHLLPEVVRLRLRAVHAVASHLVTVRVRARYSLGTAGDGTYTYLSTSQCEGLRKACNKITWTEVAAGIMYSKRPPSASGAIRVLSDGANTHINQDILHLLRILKIQNNSLAKVFWLIPPPDIEALLCCSSGSS